MGSTVVRISTSAHDALRDLAEKRGQSMQAVLDDVIEQLRRETFFDELDRAFGAVRENADEWQKEADLRGELDQTVADGLDDDG